MKNKIIEHDDLFNSGNISSMFQSELTNESNENFNSVCMVDDFGNLGRKGDGFIMVMNDGTEFEIKIKRVK